MKARGAGTSERRPHGRRQEVLATVRASASPLSILDIAGRLGVHPNTVRFHLNALLENGQVEEARPESAGPGRPPLMVRAPAGMDRAGPRNYRLLAGILADAFASEPDPVEKATEVGRAWARRTAAPSTLSAPSGPARTGTCTEDGFTDQGEAIGHLMTMLDDLGFAPEHEPERRPGQIGLRHCPFLELASDRPQVICSLHLGLMQGTMAALNTPITVERLTPYAEPDLCLVHLGTAPDTPGKADDPSSEGGRR
ncbi:transcriptional regulator [Actinomadura sp. NBRC 104412]|uniref:helix-turn-helix transcriptional regulator n=1 Tax=Actinomadura sp. NBRC 104412 TaxID=3032203 RepID=UPI0024A1AD94|nr:transcriptional regulator [Actinomadura sp. NBRC 104412]GLZ09034.1 transcriptional regulator [Actinomadura sp. NBRC 104412]